MNFWLILSQGIAVVSVIPYLHGVYSRKIMPNRISWVIICVVGFVNFLAIATASNTELPSKLFAGVLALNPLLILLASFWRGTQQKITYFEIVAAVLAMIALVTWWFTRLNFPEFALIVGIVANFFGILPTILFIRNNPDKDQPLAWFLFVLSSVFSLLSLTQFTLLTVLLPMYMIFSSSIILYFLIQHRLKLRVK